MSAEKFIKLAGHLPTCNCFTLGTCNCVHDRALDEVRSASKKIAAMDKVIDAFEWDEITGECIMACGGSSADGHEPGCPYVFLLVENGLITLEQVGDFETEQAGVE